MAPFLKPNQKIIYYRNGEKYLEILPETRIPLNYAQYIRHIQPFTKEGESLTIRDFNKDRELQTTSIKGVKKKDNSLLFQTKNSVYVIDYVGIDLEKMLKDGEDKGVNNSTGIFYSQFPNLKTGEN